MAVPGDVADPDHRQALVEAAGERIDLLVNNASLLGPSPQPALADYPLDELRRVYEVNVVAPLALVQLALPRLAPGAAILDVTSDAAVEAYEGWGGYGSSKAALEQLTAILAAEHPGCACTASTPATCARRCTRRRSPARTSPTARRPEESVPGLLALIEGELPSGRYRAARASRPTRLMSTATADRRALAAREPPEALGRARDDVALLVAHPRQTGRWRTPASTSSGASSRPATCWW